LIKKVNIVPRWIIFLLDTVICIFSLVLAYSINSNLNLNLLSWDILLRNIFIVTTVNSVVFALFRTYAGIIRYTSAQDTFRILFSLLVGNSVLYLINLIVTSRGDQELIAGAVVVINFLTSFLLLTSYRVLVKYFFMYVKNLNLDKKKVIIYGAGEAGLATKRTFDHDRNFNKAIIAFVDDDERKVGKTIDGIKIFHASLLEELIADCEIDELIFASYSIPVDIKNKIVDVCLDHDVIVLNIPPQDVWSGKTLNSSHIQNINIEDLLNRKPIDIDVQEIRRQIKGKRILITGAAGSIGSEIVRQLLNFQVGLIILCDQSETALHELFLELEENYKNDNFHPFIGDVKDKKRMQYLFEHYKPQYVYHAAAYKHVPLMEDNPAEAVKNNVLGTKVIADLSVKYGVQKFVMVSTDKAVNPTNVMGASKRIAEIYVQSLNNSLMQEQFLFTNGLSFINDMDVKPITKFITTRFGNVLGSNGSVIPRFKQQIEKGGPITVTHPEITRYFMTIPEACKLVLEAGCMGKGGEIFIFDMGKSVKIVELAKKMIRLAGLIPNQDINIEFTGLRPGEKLFEELLNNNENTIPTYHEQILIGKVREFEFNEVEEQLKVLLSFAEDNDRRNTVLAMKTIVEEFKSNNSIFEELDKEIKRST